MREIIVNANQPVGFNHASYCSITGVVVESRLNSKNPDNLIVLS